MAITYQSLRRAAATEPPRILIYGVPKIGKTSLAAEFPEAVLLQTEEGIPSGLDVATFGKLRSWDDIMDAVAVILGPEEHGFQTVILDSLDAMEPLVWAETCKRNKWPDIEAPGYGKGYIAADVVWRDFLDAIDAMRSAGMNTILIAHSEMATVSMPGLEPFVRHHIKLNKRATALATEAVDIIAFVAYDIRIEKTDVGYSKKVAHAEGSGTRNIYLTERPAFVAGNRYNMPDRILYKKGKGYSELAKYFPKATVAEEAPPE